MLAGDEAEQGKQKKRRPRADKQGSVGGACGGGKTAIYEDHILS